ncbi:MAG: hypothetical protein IJS08_12280 [Victivallales bacterium]|nr:hypothetical protein [Victivallales bacterium]
MKTVVCPFCKTRCELEDGDFVEGAMANCPSCGKDFPLTSASAATPDKLINIGPRKRNPGDKPHEYVEYVPKNESKAQQEISKQLTTDNAQQNTPPQNLPLSKLETFKRPSIASFHYGLAWLAFALGLLSPLLLEILHINTVSSIPMMILLISSALTMATVGWFTETVAKIEYNTRQGGKK